MANRERSFNGVQFENLRARLDVIFNDIHDELDAAYYQFWRQDLSKDFMGVDKAATPAESKTQFDILHGALWHLYDIAFHRVNLIEARYNESDYNEMHEGDPSNPTVIKKDQFSNQWLSGYTPTYGPVIAQMRARINSQVMQKLGYDIGL